MRDAVADEERRLLDLWEPVIQGFDSHADDLDSVAKTVALAMVPRPDLWAAMVSRSTCPFEWKVCQHLVGTLRIGAPDQLAQLPLYDWALDVAQGYKTAPPGRRGPNPFDNLFRDRAIVAAVAAIVDLGVRKPTASRPDGEGSACGLVADRLGKPYKTVEGIWRRRQKNVHRHSTD